MRLACRPCSTPIGRGATCALAAWPLAASPSTRPSRRRQPSGLEWPCASDTENGRPDAVSSRSIISNSLSGLGVLKSEMNSMTPRPASFMPSAMPRSSASEARSEGVGSPFTVRWLSVREVEKPSAPARMASAVSTRISATSSAVASSSFAARSPMTNTRNAPCGSWAPRSMSRGRASSASRYWPKDSHDQFSPSSSAAPGMSSTPSINSIRRWRSSTFTGAKPTPQLPITAVVTPCQLDGCRCESQVAWPS